VALRWTNPTDASFTRVRLLMRLDTPPASDTDSSATLVYEGPNGSFDQDVEALLPDLPYRGYPFMGSGTKPPLSARLPLRQPRVYHYALYGCAAASCGPTPARATFRRNLTEALLKGGYTLFWRHASAVTCGDEFGLGSPPNAIIPDWWKTCRTTAAPTVCGAYTLGGDAGVTITTQGPFARQLTDPAAATEIANIRTFLQGRAIPFSGAFTSEFCRCSETARGIFRHLESTLPVQERQELTLGVYGSRCPSVIGLTSAPPDAGTNLGLVSHSGMGCPTDLLSWSQAAVFKPRLTGVSCAASLCPNSEDTCVAGQCWRRELIGTICDDEWAEIPPL
jgi:phosphohistidine phosphatase SixA